MRKPPMNRRVLAVGAHPDDVEIMCAGLLILLLGEGFEAHVATLTIGDCGSDRLPPAEISLIRRREAETACSRIGAAYHYAGFEDLQIFNNDESNRRITALVRTVNPALVITHPPADYMADHEVTSLLVRNACFAAPAPNYDTSAFSSVRRSDAIPHLYYASPLEGIDVYGLPVLPGIYCDISTVLDAKLAMLACHESQREWLRRHHGIDEYLEAVHRWTAKLAERASAIANHPVIAAEAFRQHRGHAYPHDDLLAAILGDRIIAEPAFISER